MFDIHLGDKVCINSNAIQSPLLVLGQVGQGRSTSLLKITLELIANKQTGLFYDPFGDLAKDIQNYIKSDTFNSQTKFISQDEDVDFPFLLANNFIIVFGDKLNDGARHTRRKGQAILKAAYKNLTRENWLIVDEPWEYLGDGLFKQYLSPDGPKTILSSEGLFGLSKIEREQVYAFTKNLVLYKTRRIDGNWIEQYSSSAVKSSDIAAIKQYHYLFIDENGSTYDAVPWPIKKI